MDGWMNGQLVSLLIGWLLVEETTTLNANKSPIVCESFI
jgi:hypothetical protein